jgi:hypothetical protein
LGRRGRCLLVLSGVRGLNLFRRGLDIQPFCGVIPSQIKIEPGRGLPQVPVTGRHDIGRELGLFAIGFVAFIGLDPDALLLVGIDLAPSLKTSSAGPVSLILWTLGHGTDIGGVKQSTISAIHAMKEHDLSQMLGEFEKVSQPGGPIDPLSERLEDLKPPTLLIENEAVGQP